VVGKEKQLQEIMEAGVVAVIRTNSGAELVSICEAMVEGGITGVEITMTSPGAIEAIYEASKVLKGKAIIGAGSVLDPETARAAMLAGADFIVSPVLNLDVIELCKRYGKIVIPGAFSPTEILTAWHAGPVVVRCRQALSERNGYLLKSKPVYKFPCNFPVAFLAQFAFCDI
jgi:2-dehydro-3-deoxyphosphogluconate aldolase/(4S)-4-hydroxy-2-oxoglutarate aldolase